MEQLVGDRTAFIATANRPFDLDQPSVVFVHGAGQDHSIWVLPRRHFARKGFNVLAVDLPGHGKSAGPCLGTIEAMADWVAELLQSLGIERTAVVGHSMGSLVALSFAARHRQHTRALAMVGTAVPMPVSEMLLTASQRDSHDALEMLTYWGHSPAAHRGCSPTPGMWMLGCGMRLLEAAAPGVVHTDLKACHRYHGGLDDAAKVECPAMLILGERDIMTPVRGTTELVATMSCTDTVVLRGAGHALLTERPDPVLDALIRIVSTA